MKHVNTLGEEEIYENAVGKCSHADWHVRHDCFVAQINCREAKSL